MSAPAVVVTIYFDALGTAITSKAIAFDVDRGRANPLEDIDTGTFTVTLNNHDRLFDPKYAAGTYYGDLRPGLPLEVSAGGVLIAAGEISDWHFTYDVEGNATVTVTALDALGGLGAKDLAEHTSDSQMTGARVVAILARAEVAYGVNYSAEAGAALLQADFVEEGTNVLGYLQLVARTEPGWLYADQQNVLRFKGRHTTLASVPAVVFSDDAVANPGSVKFHQVTPSYASETLWNRVVVSRINGSTETFTDTDSVDLFTQGRPRTLSQIGLLFASDSQSYDLGAYLVGRYANPELRIDSIGVNLHGLPSASHAAVLGLDITDVVQVVWTPQGIGSPITQTSVVQGVRHSGRPGSHEMTLQLTEVETTSTATFFTLNDATLGQLDGGNVLAF